MRLLLLNFYICIYFLSENKLKVQWLKQKLGTILGTLENGNMCSFVTLFVPLKNEGGLCDFYLWQKVSSASVSDYYNLLQKMCQVGTSIYSRCTYSCMNLEVFLLVRASISNVMGSLHFKKLVFKKWLALVT